VAVPDTITTVCVSTSWGVGKVALRKIGQTHFIFCDFCGKSQKDIRKMIATSDTPLARARKNAAVCDECIELCLEILLEEEHNFEAHVIVPKDTMSLLNDLRPIFGRPREKAREKHCFYLGPFKEPFNTVYTDHISSALRSKGVSTERADEIFSTDVIIEDIWKGINSASLVVADVTGKNPNVLYEVGMAHTVGKPVLLMTQSMDDVPFDLKHRRCLVYEYTPRGCKKLESELISTANIVLGLGLNAEPTTTSEITSQGADTLRVI
jgi:nucleoside 2-deoxyribosyltransferase